MTAVNGITEVEVVRINGVDACVLLDIGITVVSNHHSLDISSAIAIVRYVSSYLGTVHGSEPCAPVSLSTARCTCVISITPTIVVSTNHSILRIVSLAENNHEVVPVVSARGIVGEGRNEGLLGSNLDILRVSAPPTGRVIGSTY